MPRDITVTFDDGSTHVYKGAPDDVTPDQVESRAAKEFGRSVVHLDGGKPPASPSAAKPEGGGAPTPKPTETKQPSAKDLITSGMMAEGRAYMNPNVHMPTLVGLTDIPIGVAQKVAHLFGSNALDALVNRREAAVQAAGPEGAIARQGANVIGSMPLMAIPGAPATASLPVRMGVGALTGAGTAAAMPTPTSDNADYWSQLGNQALMGGAVGAGLPLAGVGLAQTGKLIAGAKNWLSPEYAASQYARQAAGSSLPSVIAANQAAPTNLLASQAGAEAANPAYLALLHTAETIDPESTAFAVRQMQGADQLAALQRIAGGATQTEARAGQEATKGTLTALTTPMREEALGAANTAGQVIPGLQAQVDRFGNAASQNVQDVRRFVAAAGRAENMAQDTYPVAGMPRIPGANTRGRELANLADETANEAANRSLLFGSVSRDAQARIDSLAAHGLQPLDMNPLLSSIRATASSPGVRVNEVQASVLNNVADLVQQEVERGGGVIDAQALYGIRKSAVNNIIQKLYPTADAKVQNKYAAELLSKVRPLIDDAIETAGGTGWKDYLQTFEHGMQSIDQTKLAAKAMAMYKKSPQQFVELVRGNDPKTVEKVFGPGSYDIVKEMGSKMGVLGDVANQVERENTILTKAQAGAKAASDIVAQNEARLRVRVPNLLSPKIALVNKALSGLEGKINTKTMTALVKGAQSGQAMNDLLNMVPPGERSKVANAFKLAGVSLQEAPVAYTVNQLTPTQ